MTRFWANNSAAQWRAPVALQIVFALIMIIAIGFVRLLVYIQWASLSITLAYPFDKHF